MAPQYLSFHFIYASTERNMPGESTLVNLFLPGGCLCDHGAAASRNSLSHRELRVTRASVLNPPSCT